MPFPVAILTQYVALAATLLNTPQRQSDGECGSVIIIDGASTPLATDRRTTFSEGLTGSEEVQKEEPERIRCHGRVLEAARR